MLLVGLTGGIGSGKSTVARMLEERGAVVFDADVLARKAVGARNTRVTRPSSSDSAPNVLAPGGELDREALASIVFADPAARRDLEAIVHPEVRRMFAEGMRGATATPTGWSCSAPRSSSRPGCTPRSRCSSSSPRRSRPRSSVSCADRGMSEEQVRARIDAQAPLEEKAEVADVLVDNEGTLEELERQVDGVWSDLSAQATGWAAGRRSFAVMRYAAVFFDAGETLVHPHPSLPRPVRRGSWCARATRSTAETIRERGHVVFDRFQQAAGPERAVDHLAGAVPAVLARGLRASSCASSGSPTPTAWSRSSMRRSRTCANYALFDDVIPALERLRDAGIRLGVVSNFESWLELLLDELGVLGLLRRPRDRVGRGGSREARPPDLRARARACGRRCASESVYVGDNPAFDVEPALAVGMFPVLIDRRDRFPDAPGARITSMDQLPAAMGM